MSAFVLTGWREKAAIIEARARPAQSQRTRKDIRRESKENQNDTQRRSLPGTFQRLYLEHPQLYSYQVNLTKPS